MKVLLHVSKVEAMKAGFDVHGSVIVNVPAAELTPEQREELTNWICTRTADQADFDLTGWEVVQAPTVPALATATLDDVRRVLDALIVKRQKETEEKRIREEKERAEREECIQAWLNAPLDQWLNDYNELKNRIGSRPYREDERLAAKREEAKALSAKRKAELAVARKAAQAEAERKKQAGMDALQAWGKENGSALLQERITGGFEWVGLARKEYAASVIASLDLQSIGLNPSDEIPEGYENPDPKERTTPTLREIEILKAVRVKIKDRPVTVSLLWMTYKPEENEYEEETTSTMQRTEFSLTVTCPDESKRELFFVPQQPQTV